MQEIKIKSIVVNSQSFAPLAYNQDWIEKENIIPSKDKFIPLSTFSRDFTQIVTPGYNLTIVPDQMILNFNDPNEEAEALGLLKKCLNLTPTLPYNAIGLNLVYFSSTINDKGESMSKKLFYFPTKFHKFFDSADARFGIYMSRDFKNVRLKLDIKPNIVTDTLKSTQEELIVYAFNYHKDLGREEDKVGTILQLVNSWQDFISHSQSIMESFDLK